MSSIDNMKSKGKYNESYIILADSCHEELGEMVERYIKDGWHPCGGVSVAITRCYDERDSFYYNQTVYAQAMTARPLAVSNDEI